MSISRASSFLPFLYMTKDHSLSFREMSFVVVCPWHPPWYDGSVWTQSESPPRGSLSPLRPSGSLSGFWSGLFTQHLIKEKSMVHIAAIKLLKLSPGPSYYNSPFTSSTQCLRFHFHLCALNSKTRRLYSQRTQLYVDLGPQFPGSLTACLNSSFILQRGEIIWILRVPQVYLNSYVEFKH